MTPPYERDRSPRTRRQMLTQAHVVLLGAQARMGSSKRLEGTALAALTTAAAIGALPLLGYALPLALRRGAAHD